MSASLMTGPVLETERLLLRLLEPGDAAAIVRYAGDWRVAAPIATIPHPYSPDMAREFIRGARQRARQGSEFAFALTQRPQRELIGVISLRPREGYSAETGYWIGVPFWGQGYMTEALRAIIRHAFCDLGLQRVHAWHVGGNPASGRVMQKAGMRYEARLRQHVLHRGEAQDKVIYGLLRDEYLAGGERC